MRFFQERRMIIRCVSAVPPDLATRGRRLLGEINEMPKQQPNSGAESETS